MSCRAANSVNHVRTGIPEAMRTHKLTLRTEYVGTVVRMAQAVAEMPHGGQVRDPAFSGCPWPLAVLHAQ